MKPYLNLAPDNDDDDYGDRGNTMGATNLSVRSLYDK